jgi:hypothetical protein
MHIIISSRKYKQKIDKKNIVFIERFNGKKDIIYMKLGVDDN